MRRDLDISDLPKPVVEEIEAIIRAYRDRHPAGPASTPEAMPQSAPRRTVGWAKNILPELPDSFFDPLPPDILDGFEGKAA